MKVTSTTGIVAAVRVFNTQGDGSTFGSAIRQSRVAEFSPEQVAFLTFGRGLDTTRMRSMFGFEPSFTTAQAFADFAASLSPGVFGPARVRATESALVGALTAGGGERRG